MILVMQIERYIVSQIQTIYMRVYKIIFFHCYSRKATTSQVDNSDKFHLFFNCYRYAVYIFFVIMVKVVFKFT